MTDPYPYLFQDVDQFIKGLYNVNRLWFRIRFHLNEKQLRQIFDITLRITRDIAEIRQILNNASSKGGE